MFREEISLFIYIFYLQILVGIDLHDSQPNKPTINKYFDQFDF